VTFSGIFLDDEGCTIFTFSESLPYTGVYADDSVNLRTLYSEACEATGDAEFWDSAKGRPVIETFSIMFDTALGSKIRLCPGVKRGQTVDANCPTLDAYQVLGVYGAS
jgi:hypothetical protein